MVGLNTLYEKVKMKFAIFALEWNPQGKRSRGCPKATWRRTVLKECGRKSFGELRAQSNNRVRWRLFVDGLCSWRIWRICMYVRIFRSKVFFMQRVCLDRQRCNPLDRKIRGSILHMVKLNAYQRRQILISFSIQTFFTYFIWCFFIYLFGM